MRWRGLMPVTAAIAVALGGCGGDDDGGGQGGQPSPARLDPARLAAEWWQWAARRPEAEDPVVDRTGARCMQDQPGHVTFLAGTYGGRARRTCSIPAGRPVFFPVLNRTYLVEGDDHATARRQCESAIRHDSRTSATLDGRPLRPRYLTTRPYPFDPHPGAAVGELAGENVACGHHVLIPSLEPGRHELRFEGRDSTGFRVEAHYTLRVGDARS